MIPGAGGGDALAGQRPSALSTSELSARPNASPPGPSRCPILPPNCLSFLLKFIRTDSTDSFSSQSFSRFGRGQGVVLGPAAS
jgi:hypothetical protein